MRLSVEFVLHNKRINKDKNRIIMHILKLLMEKKSNNIYRELYVDKVNAPKDLTFSMYMGQGVKFLRDEIEIPSRKIIVNFSTYNLAVGIALYNSFVEYEGLEIPIKDNIFTINRINVQKPRPIIKDTVTFKTGSPIVVREHKNDNKKTYYHNLSDERGQKIFLKNLRYQIKDKFPDIEDEILDDMKIDIVENKLIMVKHYDIVVPSNICLLTMSTEMYILKYLYLNGLGSRKSQGFGYVDLVE